MNNLERLTETEVAEYVAMLLTGLGTRHNVGAHLDPRNPGDAIATITRPNGIEDTYRIRVFAL